MASSVRLTSIVFCEPHAQRFNGEPLAHSLALPERLPAATVLTPEELSERFVSVHLRPNDVPLAFHRESPGSTGSQAAKLEAYGKKLQYRFDDGITLNANQILFHPHSRLVARHLLPLSVNVSGDLKARVRFGRLTSWEIDADQVIWSVLTAAMRTIRLAEKSDEIDPISLYFALEENAALERSALRLEKMEIDQDVWGPWRISTALPEPAAGVYYGRARLEIDPAALGGRTEGLARGFNVDVSERRLMFHAFEDQLERLKSRLRAGPQDEPHVSGLSLHLSGHAQIQTAIQEMNELFGEAHGGERGRGLRVFPDTYELSDDKVHPRLSVTGDGSFRFTTRVDWHGGPWDVHGFPQSSAYLLLNLQNGLGATTGFANTQIAHTRRGIKRERDMKILKSVGTATLIFYDAASFALGLPLSDGTVAASEEDVCTSLFTRLANVLLKAEGWPVQSGSLVELCSKNVTTLIEGFVKQVVQDFRGREISLFLPGGELKTKAISRAVVLLFHAMVSDLASATAGTCFGKARARYFEMFMNGRTAPEREDVAVRLEVDAETSARMVYQPGINERYLFPDTSRPPKGEHVLSLLHRGFELSIDDKEVEEFDATDFRPEFTLRETPEETPEVPTMVQTGNARLNWFELNPKFFFKGSEISGEQASRLSREGLLEFQGKLYRVKATDMPQLSRLTRFWSQIQGNQPSADKGAKRRKTEETYFQLPRSQTLELLALRASGVKVRGGPHWDEITKFYDSLDQARPPIELPKTFQTTLQPYQMTGVQWIFDLYKLGLGGILADDMGLGKTVTSLAFLDVLRSSGQMGPCLVLVPTSLTYNWLAEAARFVPDLPIEIFSSREPERMRDFVQSNENSVVICTYGLLQENTEFFQQVRWNCLVLDEAQNLKNITTKRTTAARKLQANFKLCLTGTPLENHYGELYSLFDLIVPGSLGDLPMFRERFVNPPRVLRDDIEYLKLKTKPLLLRRTKGQVMHELPPKIETTVKLPFEEEQKKIYRDIATAYNDQIQTMIAKQGEARSQLQMLTALLRLRQVCSDPSSVPGVRYSGEPPKLSTLMEALSELTEQGASALVFTQFLATFDRIRGALAAKKIPHFDISGADSRPAREKKLRAFQDEPNGAVMLMTLKTGGVGLNLVKASYIFHIEPWWNPAVENQATDRAHRIGQTKTVQVYRYLIKDSVEEKIEILKDIKARRFDALFAANEETESELGNGSSHITRADFEFLLG